MATEQSMGWEATRSRVLDRDGHACRFCGISNDEHKDEYRRELSAHHIIPDRDGGPDHPDNLITVCESCHRTLESTHGKAMSQMKRQEDYSDDLKGVNHVWDSQQESLDEIDDKLAEFHDKHPIFAREMILYDSGGSKPTIESSQLEKALPRHGVQIDSEWRFAAAYGYREGVMDVISALDGWTNVPFDELEEQ